MFIKICQAIFIATSLFGSGACAIFAVWCKTECEDIDARHEFKISVIRSVVFGLCGIFALVMLVCNVG